MISTRSKHSTALATVTLNRPDGSPAPISELLFGGAGDNRSQIVGSYAARRSNSVTHPVHYFTQNAHTEALACARQQAAAGHRLVFIAHSWGCDTALKVARRFGEPIDLLIGADPVAKPGLVSPLLNPRPPNIKRLIHVDALPDWQDRSDFVKALGWLIGGGIPRAYRQADATITLRACHAAFHTMMTTSAPGERSAEDWINQTLLDG